ncbi:MAG TPA: agmatinase [Bacteroidetes bacterium]|nr:agmatinase [Bacteroidota bacterium]
MSFIYGGLPDSYSRTDSSRIVILPVPYDDTSTWIKGADRGPDAILEASANMELYDIDTDSEVYRLGIHTAPPQGGFSSPEEMVKEVEKSVEYYIRKGKFVVTLGGEHSISIGSIFAHAKAYGNLTVLQIDAHADLRQEYMGSRFNHACVMARAREVAHTVQVGIRSMDITEKESAENSDLFFASEIHEFQKWQQKVIGRLRQNVYITFDLDALDPSIMPSTGTPEPGGLGWYEVLDLIGMVIEQKNLVGMDVVELCPNPANRAPDFLAAKLIYQTLSMRFAGELSRLNKNNPS